MSQTGIYAGGYQRVRDYAESVDRLLLELKSGHAPKRETLGPVLTLLEALENSERASAAVQAVNVLLRSRKALPRSRIRIMRTELEAERASASTIEGLEAFAGVLDEERAAISARLRGV
jgi:hypothetical protein